tara:strand:- start:513 stop:1007 length:495 start_codon:yes stop_codon:yes gene_type:complete
MNLKYIKYAWYAVVVVLALGLLALVGPKVYNQVHYQFYESGGDPSMWKATFEGILILMSIPVTGWALLLCLNESGSIRLRWISGVLSLGLLGSWVYGALLWQQSTSSFFQQSLVDRMIANDGAFIIFIGVVFHLIFALSGKGIAAWGCHLFKRLNSSSLPDAAA